MSLPNASADISAIANYGGKFVNELLSDMFLKSDITAAMTPMRKLTAPKIITKVQISGGLRQLNTAIETAKGRRSFVPRTITPYSAMKIVEVIPEDYRDTHFAEELKEDAKDVPFAAFIWMKEVEKVQEEYLLSFWNNARVTPVAYSGAATYTVAANDHILYDDVVYKCIVNTAAGESPDTTPASWQDADDAVIFDGPGTIIAAAITASDITPVATGAVSNTNAVEKFLELFNSMPQAVRGSGKLVINCSYDLFALYQADHNTRYGTGKGIGGADLDTDSGVTLRGSAGRCRIEPRKFMNGVSTLMITTKSNMYHGFSNDPEHANIGEPVRTLHGFKVAIKHMSGFQFGDISLVGVNDQ